MKCQNFRFEIVLERTRLEAQLTKKLILGVIRAYRTAISPLLPASCRYYPSCSQYALTAVERFGAWRGSQMAVARILRCHPFHPGGYDPVPEVEGAKGDRDAGS